MNNLLRPSVSLVLFLILLGATLLNGFLDTKPAQAQEATPPILDEAELEIVIQDCREIINQSIVALEIKLTSDRQKYDFFFEATNNSLNFIANNLQQIAHDPDKINGLTGELQVLQTGFLSALDLYQSSLNELMALSDICSDQPEVFVSRLKQVYLNRGVVLSSVEELIYFIENDLTEILSDLGEELFKHA